MTIAQQLQEKYDVYEPYEGEGATDYKYSVFYDKGGYNYFSGGINRRGWYLSIQPVSREDKGSYSTETFAMFSGTKVLLNEVSRNSAKALRDARANITDGLIEELKGAINGRL